MTAPFTHRYEGRNRATLIAVAVDFLALLGAWFFFDIWPPILIALALLAVPALWDLKSNRISTLALSDEALRWQSGRAGARLSLDEIDHMRFDTRFDFSVRVSAVLTNGRKIRLPYEALPPHRTLEAAFDARGVKTRRHHFSLIG